jgi:hypothetical protein
MTPKEQLEERHNKAIETLQKVAKPKVEKHTIMPCAYAIASKLGISAQTVINYYDRKNKNNGDGFLTEAITKEFKNLVL